MLSVPWMHACMHLNAVVQASLMPTHDREVGGFKTRQVKESIARNTMLNICLSSGMFYSCIFPLHINWWPSSIPCQLINRTWDRSCLQEVEHAWVEIWMLQHLLISSRRQTAISHLSWPLEVHPSDFTNSEAYKLLGHLTPAGSNFCRICGPAKLNGRAWESMISDTMGGPRSACQEGTTLQLLITRNGTLPKSSIIAPLQCFFQLVGTIKLVFLHFFPLHSLGLIRSSYVELSCLQVDIPQSWIQAHQACWVIKIVQDIPGEKESGQSPTEILVCCPEKKGVKDKRKLFSPKYNDLCFHIQQNFDLMLNPDRLYWCFLFSFAQYSPIPGSQAPGKGTWPHTPPNERSISFFQFQSSMRNRLSGEEWMRRNHANNWCSTII